MSDGTEREFIRPTSSCRGEQIEKGPWTVPAVRRNQEKVDVKINVELDGVDLFCSPSGLIRTVRTVRLAGWS